EPCPPRRARSPTAVPHRRPAAPLSREGQGPRPAPPRGPRRNRDTRHDSPLVSAARRQEVRRLEDATPRARPSTKPNIVALVVRMATENPTWGYTRATPASAAG